MSFGGGFGAGGPRGPVGATGPQGPPGEAGEQGAAGPATDPSYLFTDTPGATPDPNDCDQVMGQQALTLGQSIDVYVSAHCKNDATKAWRTVVYTAKLNVTDGGLGQAVIISSTTSGNGPGWSGTATLDAPEALDVSTVQFPNRFILRVRGNGPAAAASCTWTITGHVKSYKEDL